MFDLSDCLGTALPLLPIVRTLGCDVNMPSRTGLSGERKPWAFHDVAVTCHSTWLFCCTD